MSKFWIRTQDRDRLIVVHHLHVSSNAVYGDGYFLGEYSSKHIATKVLDMVQEALTPRLVIDVDGRIEQIGGRDIVFQMPQENEVIV